MNYKLLLLSLYFGSEDSSKSSNNSLQEDCIMEWFNNNIETVQPKKSKFYE